MTKGVAKSLRYQQARAEELAERCRVLEEALGPFAHYAQMRALQPLKGFGDSVHSIHTGTEFEAAITVEHVNQAFRVLYGTDPE